MLQLIGRILSVLLFTTCSFLAIGQSTPQKPRWNRRTPYQLTFKYLSVDAQIWTDQSGLIVAEFQRTGSDSVILSSQDQIIGTFLAKGDRISSPRFVMKDEKGGILWIDSFRVAEQIHLQTYLANYKAALASHWSFYTNGMLSGINYKNKHGDDSLSLHYSESGILQLKKQGNRKYEYSATGVLQSVSSTNGPEYRATYYNHGALQQLAYDTLIKNQTIQYIRDYSTIGVLLKESWLKDGKPCETWREYDQTGKLVKTIQHTPLIEVSSDIGLVTVFEEAALPSLTYVEVSANYPGGQTALSKRLETDLIKVFCNGKMPLKDQYIIRFEVSEEGKVKFLDFIGWHAESIRSCVKDIMANLPRWQPGKHNGKRVKQILLLTLDFKAVKS